MDRYAGVHAPVAPASLLLPVNHDRRPWPGRGTLALIDALFLIRSFLSCPCDSEQRGDEFRDPLDTAGS